MEIILADYRKWLAFHNGVSRHEAMSDLYQAVLTRGEVGQSSCLRLHEDYYEVNSEGSDAVLNISEVQRLELLSYLQQHYLPTPEPQQPLESNVDHPAPSSQINWAALPSNTNPWRHAYLYTLAGFLICQAFILPQFFDTKLPGFSVWVFFPLLFSFCFLAVRVYKARFLEGGIRYGTVFKISMSYYVLLFALVAAEVTIGDMIRNNDYGLTGHFVIVLLLLLSGAFCGWIFSALAYFLNGGKIVTNPDAVKKRFD